MCHWNYYIFPPGPWGSTVTRNLIGLPSQCLQSKPQNIRYDSHEDKVAQHVEMITLVLTKKKKVFKRDHLIPSSYSFLFWLLLIFLNFYLFVVSSTMCTSVSTHVTAPPYPPSAFVSPHKNKQQTNTENQKVKTNKQYLTLEAVVCRTIYTFAPRALLVNVYCSKSLVWFEASGLHYAPSILNPQWDSSWISSCCSVSWRFLQLWFCRTSPLHMLST